jgi:hypothetical protein
MHCIIALIMLMKGPVSCIVACDEVARVIRRNFDESYSK